MVDIVIFIYLGFAMVSWNKPDEANKVCIKVDINIEDENENGFLKTAEVKHLLESHSLYPLSKKVKDINTRSIEDLLLRTAFVKTAQCYITNEGYVYITLTQRTPVMRVKADNGDDYYIDDNGGVMPNSQYTSDMIIVTGQISRYYACRYLSILAKVIMDDDFWRNQIEQINLLCDRTIELVPRVGEHIINIGELPNHRNKERRQQLVSEFVANQLHRMDLFYRYGLKVAGWNKYSYISLEYPNQVICTRRDLSKHAKPIPVVVQTPQPENQPPTASSEEGKKENADKKPTSDAKKTEEKADNKPTVKSENKSASKTDKSSSKSDKSSSKTDKTTSKSEKSSSKTVKSSEKKQEKTDKSKKKSDSRTEKSSTKKSKH